MNTNSYLRIEKGFDISKIIGVIPQNIGEGFQFNLSGKTYTTMGSYTKDKKRLMNIEVCWIVSIVPEKYRNRFTGNIEVRVNPAKKDGTRSNREFILCYVEIDSIKKIN